MIFAQSNGSADPITAIVFFIFALALYGLPSIIAISRGHPQFAPILVINLFFGWTLIGWVGSLAWAVCQFKSQSQHLSVDLRFQQPPPVYRPPGAPPVTGTESWLDDLR